MSAEIEVEIEAEWFWILIGKLIKEVNSYELIWDALVTRIYVMEW